MHSKMGAYSLFATPAIRPNRGHGFKSTASVLRACFLLLFTSAPALSAASHAVPEGGFGARLEAPEADVLAAVHEVAADQIIHGTFSYEKEKILYGAHAADSSTAFRETPPGFKAFYKVADRVLAPRYFKNTADIGTITVRYLVQPAGPTACMIHVDAVFVDARHRVHDSQGGVEPAEYAAVQEHLQAIALKHQQKQQQEQQEQEEANDLAQRRRQ